MTLEERATGRILHRRQPRPADYTFAHGLLLDDGRQPPQLGRLAFLGLRARRPHRRQGVVRLAVARRHQVASRRTSAGNGSSKRCGKGWTQRPLSDRSTAPAEAASQGAEQQISRLRLSRSHGRGEIRERLDALRKRYYDATHHCYAWRLGPHGETFRANDDGEPSGTAGTADSRADALGPESTDCLVAVVRYFGGTKLGVPGLIAAYRESAAAAIGGGPDRASGPSTANIRVRLPLRRR